ncbi:MAG TPA: GNAT family protein [Sphingomonas sp.]|uniref:GNAT family N-acetyltransferase n=1 Tax=Sphingomonas sp. TaxID=28214 RepID=UPI002ED9042D
MSERFESERLLFRPQRIDDAAALFDVYGDVDLMRFWSSAPHGSVAETIVYLTPGARSSDWRGWAITMGGSDRAIGTVAAGRRREGVAELGYMLARAYWGRGIAREAVTRLLDLLFLEERHRRVFADIDPGNAPSTRLVEALGFRREGLLRAEWETHIGVRDSAIWGLLRDEWRR